MIFGNIRHDQQHPLLLVEKWVEVLGREGVGGVEAGGGQGYIMPSPGPLHNCCAESDIINFFIMIMCMTISLSRFW